MMPDVVVPSPSEPTARPSPPHRSRWRSRLGWLAFWLVVVGSIAFNVWWYVLDTRPLPKLEKVEVWFDQKRYGDCAAALREILRRSPYDDEARMLFARTLAARGNIRACAEQLHRVPEWSPRKREALFLEGSSWAQLHLMRPAEAAWLACVARKDLLHTVPWEHFKAATELLIELYANEERWDDAQAVIWGIYDEVDPSDRVSALIMMLRTEIERIPPDVARESLKKQVAADPADLRARIGLVRIYEANEDPDSADREIAYCLSHWPRDDSVRLEWLSLLDGRGHLQELAQELKKLPPSAEQNGKLWIYRGRTRELVRDWSGALEAYRKAAELLPYDDQIQYRLGMSEQRFGNKQAARPHLRKSKDLKAAFSRLFDVVPEFIAAAVKLEPRDPKRIKLTTDLVDLLRTLGRDRLATALLETIEPTVAAAESASE